MTPEQELRASALLARAQTGDREAYAELLVSLTGTTVRYVRGRVGAVPWVDDVVQETLLSVNGARHTYDPSRPFAPWFYAIAHRRLIDVLRRERRSGARELGGVDVSETAAAADPEVEDDRLLRVRQAMARLPQRQREIITALKIEERSVKDVSARLGMSESAVKVTAHRGYKTLRRWLGGKS